ncbi:MAG: aromatic ring-hydroxylating oxygenase subunit alpha [Steroidobacteraceae bacterium]
MRCNDLVAEIGNMARRPWPDAVSLPPRAYFSEDLHALEIDRIFRREWLCVGHISQVPQAGSYLTAEIIGTPIAVVRAKDQSLSVLANSCVHRGTKILNGTGRVKFLVCPYHSWSYDLTGELTSAPGMSGEDSARLAKCRLAQVRHEVWNGWIYVNLQPDARALLPRLAGLSELVTPYREEKKSVLFAMEEEWPANWKMLAENFMESYHLPVVHPRTVNRGSPVSGVDCWPGGEGFAYHTLQIARKDDHPTSFEESVPAETRDKEILTCVFPSHLLSITPHNTLSLSVQPFGVDRLRASVVYLINSEYVRATGQSLDAAANSARAYFDRFNAEDKAIVARLCAGLKSSLARSGPLAPLERPLWEFHKYLARQLCDHPTT